MVHGRRMLGNVVGSILVVAACSDSNGSGHRLRDAGADAGTAERADSGSRMTADAGSDDGVDASTRDSTLVRTGAGPVRGVESESTRSFLGIPYAAPPTGENRWRAPQPVTAWTEPRDATERGKVCPQPNAQGAEDCLTLNVFTPAPPPDRAELPVMVWIHGGEFLLGSGAETYYDGSELVRAGNLVVVTLNYRLGALGFLALPELSAESSAHPTSGNYGFEDQQAALRWVKDNIAGFGGDPGNVTLFGESAGGYSVCAHLLAPGSKGLFQKAISESGWCSKYMSYGLETAYEQGKAFATLSGCPYGSAVIDCLRSKTPNELLDAVPDAPSPGGFHFQDPTTADSAVPPTWLPVVDESIVPSTIGMVTADSAKVPLLLGTNSDEGSIYLRTFPLGGVPVTNEQEYVDALERRFGVAVAAKVLAMYPISAFASANDALSAVTTDGLYACPARRLARAQSAAGADVYLYAFEHEPEAPLITGLGVFHIAEVSYVFGIDSPLATTQRDELPLVAAMQGYWTRFARTGDPNGDDAVAWPEYSASDDESLVLDLTIATQAEYKQAQCAFWDSVLDP